MGSFPRAIWTTLATILALCADPAVAADPYPVKPVRIIVASGPGSGDDFVTRVLATTSGGMPAELRKRYEHWMGIFEKIARDARVKPQ